MDKQIIVAASKVFGVSEDVIAAHVKELEKAPIALVEYTQFFKGERKREYDARRENIGVYTGDIKALVKGLKSLGGSSVAGLTPWEIIFTYYKQITPDLTSAMEQENSTTAKIEDGEISTVEEREEVPELAATDEAAEPVSELSTLPEEPVRKEDDIPTQKKLEEEIPSEIGETGAISGDTINEQGTAKCTKNTEVPKMDQNANIMDIASKIAAGTQAEEAKTTKSAKASTKPERLDKDIQGEMLEMLQGTTDERTAFMSNNHITALIATAPSVKERLVVAADIKGALADAGQTTEPEKAINEKLVKKYVGHIVKCTGKKDMTIEAFEALPEDQRYVNCATPADAAMAKQIIGAIKAAMADHTKLFDLAAPAERNVNYKGLQIGNDNVSKSAINTLLVDRTVGVLFGEGMVNEAFEYTELGQDKEKRIEVRLVVRQVAQGNTKQTSSEIVTSASGKKPVTMNVLKGRKALVQAGKVKFLYPEVNKDAQRNASLMVTFNGQPASYKYFKLDENGKHIVVGQGEKAHDALGTASLKGIGKVFEVVKVMPQEIVGDRTPKSAAEYWDVNYTAEKVENQAVSLNFDESPLFTVLTTVGAMSNLTKSQTQAQVASLLNKKSAADAAEVGNALDI